MWEFRAVRDFSFAIYNKAEDFARLHGHDNTSKDFKIKHLRAYEKNMEKACYIKEKFAKQIKRQAC